MYDGPLDEDATHVLPTVSRVEKVIAVVDGMAINYYINCSPLPSEHLLTSGMASMTRWFQ